MNVKKKELLIMSLALLVNSLLYEVVAVSLGDNYNGLVELWSIIPLIFVLFYGKSIDQLYRMKKEENNSSAVNYILMFLTQVLVITLGFVASSFTFQDGAFYGVVIGQLLLQAVNVFFILQAFHQSEAQPVINKAKKNDALKKTTMQNKAMNHKKVANQKASGKVGNSSKEFSKVTRARLVQLAERKLLPSEYKLMRGYKISRMMFFIIIIFSVLFSVGPMFLRNQESQVQIIALLFLISLYSMSMVGMACFKNSCYLEPKKMMIHNLVDSLLVMITAFIWFMISYEYIVGVTDFFLIFVVLIILMIIVRDFMTLEMKVRDLLDRKGVK